MRKQTSYSQNFLDSILEQSQEVFCFIDSSGIIKEASPSWSKILGHDHTKIVGQSLYELIYQDDKEPVLKMLNDFVKMNASSTTDVRINHDKSELAKSQVWLRISISERASANGVILLRGQNISDLKAVNSIMAKKEEVTGIGSWEIDLITQELYWSPVTYKIHEADPIQYRPKLADGIGFYHPESLPRLRACVEKLMSTGQGYDETLRMITAKGNEIWVRSIASADVRNGKVVRCFGTFENVTDVHSRAELELQMKMESQKIRQRLELAIQAVKFGVFDWNLKTSNLIWDSYMYELFEIDIKDFTSDYDAFEKTLLPEDQARVQAELGEAFAKHQPNFNSEFRIKTKSGKIKIISAAASCFYDNDGNIERLVGNNWDLTEKREMENNLRKAQSEIERFFTISMDPLCVVSTEGIFKRINNAFYENLEYSEQEMKSKSLLELVHEEDRAFTKNELRKLDAGQSAVRFENRIVTKSGSFRIFSWATGLDKETGLLFCAIRDLTDQRNTERQMIQSSQLATLGEMAGGVAHEINNPLTIVQGKAAILLRQVAKGSPDMAFLTKELQNIVRTTERIAKIVKGLRSFSRDSNDDPMIETSAAQIIEEVLDLSRERFKNHDVELRLNIGAEAKIPCRSTQIGQILMNLLNNGHDAILHSDIRWVEIATEVKGDFFYFHVTDSGHGIPAEVAARMMQPFFTTKEVGKGTGLGLSISLGIAKDHGGTLFYDGTHPHTRFTLCIPAANPNRVAAS